MTLTIELPADLEARLEAAARREAVAPEQFAQRLLREHLPSLGHGEGTLALFARWEAEDGTDEPDEIAARARDWAELEANLDAHPFTLRRSLP